MNLSTEEQQAVEQIEATLQAASEAGCNVCDVLTRVCANHLFSGDEDKCHVNGVEFGARINELGFEMSKKPVECP